MTPFFRLLAAPDLDGLRAHLAEHTVSAAELASALRHAAGRGHLDVVALLLTHGASAHADPGDDDSPLAHAALHGHLDVVNALLDAGADVDHIGRPRLEGPARSDGRNALFIAVRHKNAELVRLLLARGADANLVSGRQRRPLDMAHEAGDPAVIALLEAAGAQLVGDGALDLPAAVEANAEGRVRALASTAPPEAVRAALAAACRWAGREAVVAALIEAAPPGVLRLRDRAGGLVLAALHGRAAAASALLARGVPVDATDGEGEHALHAAGRGVQLELTELLLAASASVHQRTSRGRTALHGAAFDREARAIAERLLAAGADPSARDADGRTPRDLAFAAQNDAVVRLLDGVGEA